MNYQHLAILCTFILVYSLFTKRIEKLAVSGPILYVLFGFLVGPLVFNLFDIEINDESIKTLAELALALVLFNDASKTNLKVLEYNILIPTRLLLIGLPLTIVMGVFSGWLVFQTFSWIELAILATMLAPTDAALGKQVVTNKNVPSRIREALNVESGLNDGICVPIILLLIAIFAAKQYTEVTIGFGVGLLVQEIVIGIIVGLVITFLGDKLVRTSTKHGWIEKSWQPIFIISLAFSCFTMAQLFGGSGFIACFIGGMLFGKINKNQKSELLEASEGSGEILSLITWVIFGSVVVTAYLEYFTIRVVIYALLSITLIRIIPVLLALTNTGLPFKERLFIGWFGPRGLASVVFAIMVLEVDLPNNDTIMTTTICTIIFSILAHGISANPLIKRLN
jgi:NhaP-type Na+/H+ or K+/H+ antiporter